MQTSRIVLVTLLVIAAVFLGGCAGMTRTEGSSGPLAWRVTNPAIVTRNIQGQPTDTYDFTLVVKNVTDRPITLTRMHRTIYMAGGGAPGYSSVDGRWEIRPGGEWRFPLYSYEHCTNSSGCTWRGVNQPIWQIVFTGVDAASQFEARVDITLPARPHVKPIELSAARRAAPSSEPPPVGRVAGIPQPASPPAAGGTPSGGSAVTSLTEGVQRKEVDAAVWREGYEWEYRWQSPRGSGTFVWSVVRTENISGTDYWVVQSADGREILWRKRDNAYYMDRVFNGVETRVEPPNGAPWPLVVGKTWELRYKRERPIERSTSDEVRECVVEKQERVTVPAGTFDTLKVICTDPRSQAVTLEVWYSPEVKNRVKERTMFNYGVQDRELLRYRLE